MNAQRTSIRTEYLMTLHSPLDPAHAIGGDLEIFNAREGGWIKGPRISGSIIPPTGDWLRVMPGGTRKLDVRMAVRADDGSVIYITYAGRIKLSVDAAARLAKGETLGPDDMYFVVSPTFETSSPKYAWLNDLVAIGKIVSCSDGEDSHVTYEIFAVS